MVGLHGIFKRNSTPHNREKGINSCCMTGFCIFRHAAGKCKHRFLKFFGNLCNAGRCFPHDGLTVQTAFSGDDNICIFYIVGKMCFFQNDVYTGFQSGMEKGEKSKPKATGSPSSCMRGIRFRKAFSGECGIGGKPLIHLLDHGRICAFLRTENGTASLRTAERICHITGNPKRTLFQFRQHMGV